MNLNIKEILKKIKPCDDIEKVNVIMTEMSSWIVNNTIIVDAIDVEKVNAYLNFHQNQVAESKKIEELIANLKYNTTAEKIESEDYI